MKIHIIRLLCLLIFAPYQTGGTFHLPCVHGHHSGIFGCCVCDVGYVGLRCDTVRSRYCFNGGIYQYRLHRCQCPSGFSGNHCEQRVIPHCYNGGHVNKATNKCKCTSNWTGFDCRKIVCQHGQRTQQPNHCICQHGYTGTYCEQMVCLNGGTYDNYGHKCSCTTGYTGMVCETKQVICLNGGIYDYVGHKCTCTNGYIGNICQTKFECLNGGTLSHKTDSCICAFGWTGQHCERDICVHGHFNQQKRACVCDTGFMGIQCSLAMPPIIPSAIAAQAVPVQTTVKSSNLVQILTATTQSSITHKTTNRPTTGTASPVQTTSITSTTGEVPGGLQALTFGPFGLLG